MPKFNIETAEKEKPIVLISGDSNPLANLLISDLKESFKIVLVSNRDSNYEASNFYRIKKDSAHLIKSIEEKIDYAVIFLEEKEDRKFIPHIFEKLGEDQSKTIIVFDIKTIEDFYDVILEYKKFPNFYFLFSGDIYSENDLRESETSKIIQKAIKNKSILLTGNDLTPIFPIYYKDAIEGIKQILYGPSKQQKIFYLFYSHPQTLISAVHIISRVEPDLEISYQEQEIQENKKPRDAIENEIVSKILVKPQYLDKYFMGFEKSLHFFENVPGKQDRGVEEISSQNKRPEPLEDKPKRKSLKFFLTSFFIALFFYLSINILLIMLGILSLRSSMQAFKNNDMASLSKNIQQAKLFLEATNPTVVVFSKAISLSGSKSVDNFFSSAESGMGFLNRAANDFGIFAKLPKGVDRELVDHLISEISDLYFRAQLLNSETKNQILETILTPDLAALLSISQVYQQVLGFDSEKNYLLLFQNNGELRPTGGFIGSLGEIKIKSGKIEEFKIQDVYEYDGKLKAHVEPHYIVRRYLQPHLYLRDSNFDFDFQRSASMSALLYKLETGKKVDGVITVDFEAVRQVIKEVGPIKLRKYNKTLDERNAFDFLQTTIDKDFFPGSFEKREVLESLFNQLILKIEADKDLLFKFARIFPKLVREKHILFAFNGKSVQSVFSSNGYAGEYRDMRKKDKGTIFDFLGINEANIGINKANIQVERRTSYGVSFESNKIISTLKYEIINNFDEDYKSYIRIITPKDSSLSQIKIDGKTQKIIDAITDYRIYERKNFSAPEGLEVDNLFEGGLQTFGFVVNVPKKSTRIINVIYENSQTIPSSSIVEYSLLLIKQPGTLTYPFTLTIDYGEEYSPKEVENATLENGVISISQNLLSDKEFQAKLLKR